MKKICFVIPYFGIQFPKYFQYFLKTACYNTDVDFLIFTNIVDSGIDSFLFLENINSIEFNIEEFNELASAKLKMSIDIRKPYKLCDFKPAYGVIFEEYLKDYDFWGYCDIDLLFGNIRKFITKEKLEHYDIISARKEYLSGFFAIFKNSEAINNAFKRSRDWKLVFTSNESYCFDECNWKFQECLSGVPIEKVNSEIESMTHVLAKSNNEIHTLFETICHEYLSGDEYFDELNVSKNGVFSKQSVKEYLLIHFIQLKRSGFFHSAKIDLESEYIYIDRFGISNSIDFQSFRKKVFLDLVLTFDHINFNILHKDDSFFLCQFDSSEKYLLQGIDKLLLFFENDQLTSNELSALLSKSTSNRYVGEEQIKNDVLSVVTKGLSFKCLKIKYRKEYDDFLNVHT